MILLSRSPTTKCHTNPLKLYKFTQMLDDATIYSLWKNSRFQRMFAFYFTFRRWANAICHFSMEIAVLFIHATLSEEFWSMDRELPQNVRLASRFDVTRRFDDKSRSFYSTFSIKNSAILPLLFLLLIIPSVFPSFRSEFVFFLFLFLFPASFFPFFPIFFLSHSFFISVISSPFDRSLSTKDQRFSTNHRKTSLSVWNTMRCERRRNA